MTQETGTRVKYAPQEGETGEQYLARVSAIPNPNPLAVRAARIVATAIIQGIYDPVTATKDELHHALQHLVSALQQYDVKKASVTDSQVLMRAVIEGRTRIRTDIKIGSKLTRNYVPTKTQNDFMLELSQALSGTSKALKGVAGFETGEVSSNDVIRSVRKKYGPAAAQLVEDIQKLREECRKGMKKH